MFQLVQAPMTSTSAATIGKRDTTADPNFSRVMRLAEVNTGEDQEALQQILSRLLGVKRGHVEQRGVGIHANPGCAPVIFRDP
jgi:hypothetical protein